MFETFLLCDLCISAVLAPFAYPDVGFFSLFHSHLRWRWTRFFLGVSLPMVFFYLFTDVFPERPPFCMCFLETNEAHQFTYMLL